MRSASSTCYPGAELLVDVRRRGHGKDNQDKQGKQQELARNFSNLSVKLSPVLLVGGRVLFSLGNFLVLENSYKWNCVKSRIVTHAYSDTWDSLLADGLAVCSFKIFRASRPSYLEYTSKVHIPSTP